MIFDLPTCVNWADVCVDLPTQVSQLFTYYVLRIEEHKGSIIQALDELNDLERLVSICKGKIPQDRQGSIHDVRSLFEELKNNNCLRVNHLSILKAILTQTEKPDLLEKVNEFEERRTLENKFERRKGVY